MILRPLQDERRRNGELSFWTISCFCNGFRGSGFDLSYLSCPTDSPEPSSLLQPASSDEDCWSQSLSSLAVMLTKSLNSLDFVLLVGRVLGGLHRVLWTYWMTVSSSLTILTDVAENESRAVWVDQGSCSLLRVDECADKK